MSVDQKDGTCSCESTQERAKLNKQLAQMLKGGVIMDVTTPRSRHGSLKKQALAPVMALELHPSRYQTCRWRFAHERSEDDQGHPGSR